MNSFSTKIFHLETEGGNVKDHLKCEEYKTPKFEGQKSVHVYDSIPAYEYELASNIDNIYMKAKSMLGNDKAGSNCKNQETQTEDPDSSNQAKFSKRRYVSISIIIIPDI